MILKWIKIMIKRREHMPKLTDKQQEIINYIDGPILVTAGPGSGTNSTDG